MGKPASRIGDHHVCPKMGHVGGPVITSGAPTVIIVGKAAATVTSKCKCRGEDDEVTKGSSTVLLSGHAAARIGDATKHGGKLVQGANSVIVGG